MQAIGRVFFVFAGIAVGCATGLLILPILIFFDPYAGPNAIAAFTGAFAGHSDIPPGSGPRMNPLRSSQRSFGRRL